MDIECCDALVALIKNGTAELTKSNGCMNGSTYYYRFRRVSRHTFDCERLYPTRSDDYEDALAERKERRAKDAFVFSFTLLKDTNEAYNTLRSAVLDVQEYDAVQVQPPYLQCDWPRLEEEKSVRPSYALRLANLYAARDVAKRKYDDAHKQISEEPPRSAPPPEEWFEKTFFVRYSGCNWDISCDRDTALYRSIAHHNLDTDAF